MQEGSWTWGKVFEAGGRTVPNPDYFTNTISVSSGTSEEVTGAGAGESVSGSGSGVGAASVTDFTGFSS